MTVLQFVFSMFHIVFHARNEIVVTSLVVNFFCFLVITRSPLVGFGRNLVQILPTGPPDLFKPSRDLRIDEKPKFMKLILWFILKNNDY